MNFLFSGATVAWLMNNSYKPALLGVIAAIAITTTMDATGYSSATQP
jgi:hypothetical protein